MTSTAQRADAAPASSPLRTARLLAAGLAAGPLFGISWLVQGLLREGYDFARHPLSLLALGAAGWVQVATFVVTGGLVAACAVGMRRVLRGGGAGGRWAPRLVGLVGAGLVVAGVFPADAGAGFPPGAPEGAPVLTWQGVVHELGYLLTVVAWIAACLVLRKRFAVDGRRGWARASLVAVPAVLLLVAVPHLDSFPVRTGLAAVAQLAFLGLAARRIATGR